IGPSFGHDHTLPDPGRRSSRHAADSHSNPHRPQQTQVNSYAFDALTRADVVIDKDEGSAADLPQLFDPP
ncbi:MAG: hypothetical protein LC799_29300, partial [Actinobacteria bacterium]|nr:hypothetical protein [Actinomycetota bacterium]